MKVITMILSLIILILSVKPCSEENNTEDRYKDEIGIKHNHLNDCDDSCPITCICCGISVAYLFTENFNLELDIEISTLDPSTYQSNYYYDYHFNIWQPPQLIS